jgi:hypothetical protein
LSKQIPNFQLDYDYISDQWWKNCMNKSWSGNPMAKNSSTWAFFCVDDESLIHVKTPRVMSCMMCCNRILNHALLNNEQSWGKVLFHISKVMKQHTTKTCGCRPSTNCQKIEKKMNSSLKKSIGKTNYKEKTNSECKCKLHFLGGQKSLQKGWCQLENFCGEFAFINF